MVGELDPPKLLGAVDAPLDPACAVTEGPEAGADDPPAAPVAVWPVEPAVDDAGGVRLGAVLTSDCGAVDAVLVALLTAEEAAPVAVLAVLETVEPAAEVTEDAVELTLEVTLDVVGGVTDGSPEAALVEAPMPMADSSATVRTAATMRNRPGIRSDGRLNRGIRRNNPAAAGKLFSLRT